MKTKNKNKQVIKKTRKKYRVMKSKNKNNY